MEEEETGQKQDELPLRDEHGRLLPGQCGNPNGRPKGRLNFATRYRDLCAKMSELPVPAEIADSKRGKALRAIAGAMASDFSNGEGIAAATMFAALNGESWAIQQLAGKPDQNLDIKSDGEKLGSGIDVDDLSEEQIGKITDAIICINQARVKSANHTE